MIPRVIQITGLAEAELLARIDRGGPDLGVQLRSPELSARELLTLGRTLRERTRRVGALFFVNDRLDLALLLEADGLHLGRGSVDAREARRALGAKLVTRSVHDERDLSAALAEGVDAALVSPIFASPEKGSPRGLAWLTALHARAPDLALVALGGVTAQNAAACFAAGAAAVAGIRHDLTAWIGTRL